MTELPAELLGHILSFLPFSQQLVFRLVNVQFNEAFMSLYPEWSRISNVYPEYRRIGLELKKLRKDKEIYETYKRAKGDIKYLELLKVKSPRKSITEFQNKCRTRYDEALRDVMAKTLYGTDESALYPALEEMEKRYKKLSLTINSSLTFISGLPLWVLLNKPPLKLIKDTPRSGGHYLRFSLNQEVYYCALLTGSLRKKRLDSLLPKRLKEALITLRASCHVGSYRDNCLGFLVEYELF